MHFLVVIPNLIKDFDESRWLLRRAVFSVRAREPRASIVVIDDGSKHPRKNSLYMELMKETRCIIKYLPENVGYARTINYGLEAAKRHGADVAVTLNSDCEMLTPFSDIIREKFHEDEKCAVVGCKLLYPSGQIQHAGFSIDHRMELTLHDRGVVDMHAPGEANNARYIFGVTGAFQAIRVSALKDIGLYSEEYFLAYEDVEFCLRVWDKGYRIYYEPSIVGLHFEGATRGVGVSKNELNSIHQFMIDREKYNPYKINDSIRQANLKKTV